MKKKWRSKILNTIDREPIVVFIQNSDESDQWVPKNLTLKSRNTEAHLAREKEGNQCDMSVCAKTSLRSSNKNEFRERYSEIMD